MHRYRLPASLFAETFDHFRQCGCGRRECQVVWISPWASPDTITDVVHPRHDAQMGGFVLRDDWLNAFWLQLAEQQKGVRVQVHTHPNEAFHSPIDDAFPIIHSSGFLSLVIPDFGLGQLGFGGAYLAQIQPDGRWREVPIDQHLVVI
jgi:hypothetical protein